MYEAKLSIIIPTRNRQQYAFKCIMTLLKFLTYGFEIVVQDNSDDDSLRDMLGSAIDDMKLKYSYDNSCLSFCSNFEKSVELSCGDYLIVIGDDDCVFPQIVELVDVLREKKIDAAVFSTQTNYIWPSAVSKNSGKLVVRKQRSYVKKVDTSSAWNSMIAIGNYDYQNYPFPKIYHGIVSREKFDLVKAKTGHYFGGLTPDIYSAVSLSFYIDSVLYINTPFSLPGVCAKSGSADALTGRHTGDLKDAPHFRGNIDYQWEKEIPYVYTVDTIWAETAFKAAKENGKNVFLSDNDYFNFLVYILKRAPVFKDKMIELYANKISSDINVAKKLIEKAVKKLSYRCLIKKYWTAGVQVFKGRFVYKGVEDIEKSLKIAMKDIKTHQKVIEIISKGEW